jgi:hypothetical protein
MAKALGADIIEFYRNGWPDGWYHDDATIEVEDQDDGTPVVQPNEKYDLVELGVLVDEAGIKDHVTFASAFNRWKKTRDVDTVVVSVPKDKSVAFRAEMKAQGFKVS